MTPDAPGENSIYGWEDINKQENSGYIKQENSGYTVLTWLVRRYLDKWGNFKQGNSGYTVLTWLIRRYLDEWENFINRLEGEGETHPEDLEKMRNLKFGEKLDIQDRNLILKIRLWVSARGQPYYRTLRGKLHYVPILQLFAEMNHPEWTKEEIKKETNKKFQILWGAYYRQLQK